MGLFDIKKKIHQIDNEDEFEVGENLARSASDAASRVIKELSGKSTKLGKKMADNVIVFTNASGGTGASTLAHNVAYTAIEKGVKTILIDLNILCPSQHIYLGVKSDLKSKDDLVAYLLGKSQLSDCIDKTHRVHLMYSINRTLSDDINCSENIGIANFNEMIKRLRQLYDLVIIDCPMTINNMLQNVALYECDTIYCVWDEGISSMVNTERLRRNMAFSGIDSFVKLKVILNKRTSVHFSSYPLKKLNIELVETLPFDVDIIDNSLKGRIFCENGTTVNENANIFAQKIESLTDKILKIGGYVE